MKHAMTIDVEDYFQVSAFENLIAVSDWEKKECRVEANMDKLLQLFADNDTVCHPNLPAGVLRHPHRL